MKRFLATAAAVIACASAASAQTVTPSGTNYATAPVAVGSWAYHPVPGGSDARFVDATGTARLVLHCSKATRRVTISRTSTVAANALQLWTESTTRALPARYEANGFRVSADVAANDRLLDALAFSSGRFAVVVPGVEVLVVPSWAEPARVVEDCRI